MCQSEIFHNCWCSKSHDKLSTVKFLFFSIFSDNCQGMSFQTADENRCEDFYTYINDTWISESCKYPELYSNITNKCDAFEKVDCGKRFIPVSPCKYLIMYVNTNYGYLTLLRHMIRIISTLMSGCLE